MDPMRWVTLFLLAALTGCIPTSDNRPANPASSRDKPASKCGLPRDSRPRDEPEITANLVRHPWWRVKMTEDKVKQIVTAIVLLQPEQNRGRAGQLLVLMLSSDGKTLRAWVDNHGPAMPGLPDESRTSGMLQGGEDRAEIVFLPGDHGRKRNLTSREALDLLVKMVDAAHASEEKFRKTGEGDSILDQLNNATKNMPSAINEKHKGRQPKKGE